MITQPIVNPVEVSAPAAVAPPSAAPVEQEIYLKSVEVAPEPVAMNVPAPQAIIPLDFEIAAPRLVVPANLPVQEEKVVYPLNDDAPAQPVADRTEVTEARLSPNEHQMRVEERVTRMREVSQKLRTPNGLNDMEREPAYKRKNIQINDTQHSTSSTVSRYTLSEETDESGERRVELKRNNPYLHDNVD
jgi:cell division protein FtsZ